MDGFEIWDIASANSWYTKMFGFIDTEYILNQKKGLGPFRFPACRKSFPKVNS